MSLVNGSIYYAALPWVPKPNVLSVEVGEVRSGEARTCSAFVSSVWRDGTRQASLIND